MTIDPLTIPCPFCEEAITELSEDAVTCEVCDIDIPIHEWITGGINALAGKLIEYRRKTQDILSRGKS